MKDKRNCNTSMKATDFRKTFMKVGIYDILVREQEIKKKKKSFCHSMCFNKHKNVISFFPIYFHFGTLRFKLNLNRCASAI